MIRYTLPGDLYYQPFVKKIIGETRFKIFLITLFQNVVVLAKRMARTKTYGAGLSKIFSSHAKTFFSIFEAMVESEHQNLQFEQFCKNWEISKLVSYLRKKIIQIVGLFTFSKAPLTKKKICKLQ